jgi:hypothetical protein
MQIEHKYYFALIGYGFALGDFILIYIMFLKAYFHPSQTLMITINASGEADIEFVLIPILLAISIIGFIFLWRDA